MPSKQNAALTAIIVPLLLGIVKGVTGILTLSISVFASALDSFMDAISAIITYAAVKTSEKPADRNHPFGHGKADAIAGLIQAILIFISASFLIYQAFQKIIFGYHLSSTSIGIGIMTLTMITSLYLAHLLKCTADKTASTALLAEAMNFRMDVWSNAGVLIALGMEHTLGVQNADPILSIIISITIIYSGFNIASMSISQLMDKTLPDEMIQIIEQCISRYSPQVHGYHDLRTRFVGTIKEISLHIEMDNTLSFQKAHDISESIVDDISKALPHAIITIHTDPI